jgi:hypothetical protein
MSATFIRSRRGFSFSLRTLLLGLMLLGVLSAYVASYYVLSRRGMRESQEIGSKAFLYVPWQEALATRDLTKHRQLTTIYYPLNAIDRSCFGGAAPVLGIMWELQDP